MKKIAVYPGTFDPITFGHLDVIRSIAAVFDEVVVGLLINQNKKPMFTADERAMMIKCAVSDLKITNVRIVSFNGLTVELARQEKAATIIRGLRLTTEYEAELNLIFNNRILDSQINTFLVPPRQEHIHISSSAVRELIGFGSLKLETYVPRVVLDLIGTKRQ